MERLADIIDLQFKMIELSRKHGRKKEPQIAICLDDVRPEVLQEPAAHEALQPGPVR